jgi:hypothetical protein
MASGFDPLGAHRPDQQNYTPCRHGKTINDCTSRPTVMVTADGRESSYAGSWLLADLAATKLTGELSAVLDGVRGEQPRHDPGGCGAGRFGRDHRRHEAISDIAAVADKPALFGPVVSDSTCCGCSMP